MRALLVSPTSPWGESFGAQQRTALLYSSLTELMPVDVLLIEEGSRNEAAHGDRPEILAKLSWKQPPFTIFKYRVNAWANSWCHSNINWRKYGLIVSRYFTPMTKIDWPRHVRTLVDCDDAYYRYAPKRGAVLDRAEASVRGWMRLWQTKQAIKRYDHVFFCSLRDCRLFRCRSTSILPNVVHVPPAPSDPRQDTANTALIIGSMWYAPNRLGVDWFIEHCWPEIAARCPALVLRIVGPTPTEVRHRWQRAMRTEVPGFVEDLGAEYARALFTIAPIHYGGGTCVKFLEAAAYRRPCIVTEHVFAAFEGDFRNGHSVMVAKDARSMVQECITLCEDADLRSSIAELAFQMVTHSYTVQRFRDTVQNAVRALLAAAAAA